MDILYQYGFSIAVLLLVPLSFLVVVLAIKSGRKLED